MILPRGHKPRKKLVRLGPVLPALHAEYLAGATSYDLAAKYGSAAHSVMRALKRYDPTIKKHRYGQKPIDEVGKTYGRLKVLRYSHSHGRGAYFVCVCLCGAEVTVRGYQLRQGRTVSCGCQKRENNQQRIIKACILTSAYDIHN